MPWELGTKVASACLFVRTSLDNPYNVGHNMVNEVLKMKREFVMTEWFDASWGEQNLTDEDLRRLQGELLQNPKCGDVIQGTGGFRKVRFALLGRGKRGGLRVIYLDVHSFEVLYLVLAYPKSEKDTISPAECAELKKIAANIKNNLQIRSRKGKSNA